MAMTKVKNLQLWCKKMAEGYRDVEVRDMASSWKSGLAFCAIIHRFRPDLIDYDSLSKENVFENNDLAFEVAEKQLNIPAFLEAADMVAIRVPDKLSVVTYVSQYYNYFHNKPQLGGPGVNKFNASNKKKDTSVKPEGKSLTPVTANSSTPQPKKERQESIGDKCLMCHERVYLLERHIENGKLYHRSCFRKSENSPASKVFKRQPVEEEKNDSHSNKLRKLNNGVTKEPEKTPGSGPDFWQRRAQKKAEQVEKMDSDSNSDKTQRTVSTSVINTDKPEWQTDLEKKHKSKIDETPKSGLFHTRTNADKDRKTEPSASGGLVNRFKELNDRNLQHLGANETSQSGLSHTKATPTPNKRPPKFGVEIKDEDNSAKPSHSPVPKPRHNVLSKPERMDTETSATNGPTPVSRFKKTDDSHHSHVPNATPRNLLKTPKSPENKKSDFLKPKSPPQTQKSKFSLNLNKNVSEPNTRHSIESPSSPPPLPGSSPPRMQRTESPKHPHVPKFSMETSPLSSPRSSKPVKVEETSKPVGGYQPPPKPPRTSVFVEDTKNKPTAPSETSSKFGQKTRSDSPMDTGEMHAAPKTVIKGPDTGLSAVLVTPNRPQNEKKNREVFGGLMKSLADVRHKHDGVGETKTEIGAKTDNKSINGVKTGEEKTEVKHKFEKVSDTSKSDWKNKGAKPQRPKSSFVSQSSNMFDTKDKHEANVSVTKTTKTKTTTTVVSKTKNGKTKDLETVVEKTVISAGNNDDIPEWKKKLEQRKKDKARPKSSNDVLNDKPETSGKDIPLWQIEAEKRKEARKGKYEDPEKAKLNTNSNSNDVQSKDEKTSRPLSPPQHKPPDKPSKFISGIKADITKPKSPEPKRVDIHISKPSDDVTENKKKKITVAGKFNFKDIELKPTGQRKPPRPDVSPLQSPTSPGPKHPPHRPPPPKTTTPKSPAHHLTAYQIQKQLKMIDERLTKLELKGRTLEDSIRKAKEEDEDDLMINWFQLVNEKNELVRSENDYIYISREQELEIEQMDIDQRLRDLVDKPKKTKADDVEELMLMEKLVEVVNQRSKIVDSIDEDRIRYLEEDSHIQAMLEEKGFLKDSKGGMKKKDKAKK